MSKLHADQHIEVELAYDKSGKVAVAYKQFGKEVAELGAKQRKQN